MLAERVSVALTTYNGSQYIIELLDSLRRQTRKPDEVLIADDQSTDNTVEIVKEYIKKYKLNGWHIYVNKHNLGWMKNFTSVISKTTGDYIFTADQDDIWNIEKIERYLKCFELNPDAWLVCSDFKIIGNGDKAKKTTSMLPISYTVTNSGSKWVNVTPIYSLILRPGCVLAFTAKLKEIYLELWQDNIPHDSLLWAIAGVSHHIFYLDFPSIEFRREDTNASASIAHDIRYKRSAIIQERIINRWYLNSEYLDPKDAELVREDDKWNDYRYELLFNHNPIYWFALFKYRHFYKSTKQYLGDVYYYIRALF